MAKKHTTDPWWGPYNIPEYEWVNPTLRWKLSMEECYVLFDKWCEEHGVERCTREYVAFYPITLISTDVRGIRLNSGEE